MILHFMPQRSEEWYSVRLGKFTASDFDTLMPSTKQDIGDFNKTQMAIIYRVASERMTGKAKAPWFVSQSMANGIYMEAEAVAAYEIETGNAVDRMVGFVEWSDWLGSSPDGISSPGGVEIKCPDSATHLRYMLNHSELLADYSWQAIGSMYFTSSQYWDLVSYDPRFIDPSKQLVIKRIEYDQQMIDRLCARLDAAILKAKEIMG